MGPVFEEICAQYLWHLLLKGELPMDFSDLGRWWGNDPVEKKQTEIDLMALNADSGLFAECKWTNEIADTAVLDTLVHRSGLFRCHRRFVYLFSRTGFTKGCQDRAKALGNVTLVTYSDMLRGLGQ